MTRSVTTAALGAAIKAAPAGPFRSRSGDCSHGHARSAIPWSTLVRPDCIEHSDAADDRQRDSRSLGRSQQGCDAGPCRSRSGGSFVDTTRCSSATPGLRRPAPKEDDERPAQGSLPSNGNARTSRNIVQR
jgi:hypothetical protein